MLRPIAIAVMLAGLAVAGCGGGDPGADSAQAVSDRAAIAANQVDTRKATGTRIVASGSDYGRILFDGDRQAIYLFEKERGSTAKCYGACATAWPPVLTKGTPRAGRGAKSKLLGTTKRKDGTTQVTYA